MQEKKYSNSVHNEYGGRLVLVFGIRRVLIFEYSVDLTSEYSNSIRIFGKITKHVITMKIMILV